MSPRPAPTRVDSTAHKFLDAAAALIDLALVPPAERGRHPMNAMHFPGALDWIRIDDVVQIAQGPGSFGASRKALQNRWPNKDSFIRDAVIHALLYVDSPERDPLRLASVLSESGGYTSFSDALIGFGNQLADELYADPRSFLLIHIGPLLADHSELQSSVLKFMEQSRVPWYEAYQTILNRLNLRLRRGWTIERLDLALQTMLDGFLLRARLEPTSVEQCRWQDANLFADSIVAFTLGVIRHEGDDLTSRERLDEFIAKGY